MEPLSAKQAVTSPGGVSLQRFERRVFYVAALLNFLLWGYFLWRVRPSADSVILHSTIYFGPDRTGEWYRLFSLPLAGAIVLGVNLLLAAVWRKWDPMARSLLAGMAGFVQLVLWVAAVVLVS